METATTETERWSPVQIASGSFSELYEVSDLGKVKTTSTRRGTRTQRVLLGTKTALGYVAIKLSRNGVTKAYPLHRIVLSAFVPQPNKDRNEVNHKNGIKTDNRLENLEWVTRSENMTHAFATDLAVPKRGEQHANRKLSEVDVLDIRRLLDDGVSQKALCQQFNVSKFAIYAIQHRITWKHI